MRKKIIILGSTGSIGKNTINIIKKDKKNFEIKLLSTNKNFSEIIKQAKEFKVKNIIINDYKKFNEAKKKYKRLNIHFHNSFSSIDKLFKKKEIFYSMVSIIGIDGLDPSLKLIKFSKNIAIVNKESLVCGWSLVKKKLDKYKTSFIPIDSEHFSIFSLLQNYKSSQIEKIYITASGGPFLNYTQSNLKNITINSALKHPNWIMGKKISIDSSTMMNKVFEVIEAKNIFNIQYKDISILTHPKSYVHAIVKFKNGLIKLLIHETDMKIPIFNSIYNNQNKYFKSESLDLEILNNLELKKININQFPLVKILNKLPKFNSLYETAIITINDFFVNSFLKKELSYSKMIKSINKLCNQKDILKFKRIPVKNINQILKLRSYLILKMENFVYKI
jgi:1-deoxy-D-xylulose-5-phosphate reductoisomerase